MSPRGANEEKAVATSFISNVRPGRLRCANDARALAACLIGVESLEEAGVRRWEQAATRATSIDSSQSRRRSCCPGRGGERRSLQRVNLCAEVLVGTLDSRLADDVGVFLRVLFIKPCKVREIHRLHRFKSLFLQQLPH